MEDIIQKVIALNKARSYFTYKLPGYIESETSSGTYIDKDNWGDNFNYRSFPANVIVQPTDVIYDYCENLGLSKCVTGNKYEWLCQYSTDMKAIYDKCYLFRYKEMLHIINFVNNLFSNKHIEVLQKRNKRRIFRRTNRVFWDKTFEQDGIERIPSIPLEFEIMKYFLDNKNKCFIVKKLPNPDKLVTSFCPIYCVLPIDVYDEFNRLFNADLSVMVAVYTYIMDLFENSTSKTNLSIPYFDFDILVTQDFTENGVLTPMFEEWIPNKHYYFNDIVYYKLPNEPNGALFRLKDDFHKEEKNGDICIGTDNINNLDRSVSDVLMKSLTYVENSDLCDNEYKHEIYNSDKNTLKKYYFKGYYDENRLITYFDNVDENGNIIIKDNNNNLIETTHWIETTDDDVSRHQKAVEEVTDNEWDIETTATSRFEELINRRWLFTDDDAKTFPFIETDISGVTPFFDENATNNEVYQGALPIKLGEYGLSYGNKITVEKIVFFSLNGNVDTMVFEYDPNYNGDTFHSIIKGEDYITPNIIPNAELYDGLEFVYTLSNDGKEITYTDRITYALRIRDFSIDGFIKKFIYFGIPLTINESIVKYNTVSPKLYNIGIYKDESLNGVHHIDINNKIGRIDRGNASALERHNILSEIDTIEDLENYRNNYFNL